MILLSILSVRKNSKGNEFLSQTLTFLSTCFATRCRRHLIFQDMNSVKSNSISLKHEKFTLLD